MVFRYGLTIALYGPRLIKEFEKAFCKLGDNLEPQSKLFKRNNRNSQEFGQSHPRKNRVRINKTTKKQRTFIFFMGWRHEPDFF